MEWLKLMSRGNHPTLLVEQVLTAHRDVLATLFNLPPVTYMARHSGSLFVDKSETEAIYEAIRSRLTGDWPAKTVEMLKSDIEAALTYAETLPVTTTPTRDQLEHFFSKLLPVLAGVNVPILVGRVIDKEIERLTSQSSPELKDHLVNAATNPLYPSVQRNYLSELETSTDEEILERYPWIKSYFMEIRPLTIADVEEDRKLSRSDNSTEKEAPEELGELTHLLKMGRLYTWFRDWRLFGITKIFYIMRPIFTAYAARFGLDYAELKYLTKTEFLSGIFELEELAAREKEFGIILDNGIVDIVTGPSLATLKQEVCERAEKPVGTIYGRPANPGKAVGFVKIASPYTFNQVKAGDILVTPETTPESVPFIRHVKAIVTDEGGITSHAAIIAREWGIPCIVATKNASTLLRDGDQVEVDADTGTVKIIKRNS